MGLMYYSEGYRKADRGPAADQRSALPRVIFSQLLTGGNMKQDQVRFLTVAVRNISLRLAMRAVTIKCRS